MFSIIVIDYKEFSQQFCKIWKEIQLKRPYHVILMLWRKYSKIDYQLKYAIFSTACSIVYKYCTWPISKHLNLGIFKDPLDTKHKIFKKRLKYKCYVSCLKLEYFFKSCMGIIFNKWLWDVTLKTYRKNVACRAGST